MGARRRVVVQGAIPVLMIAALTAACGKAGGAGNADAGGRTLQEVGAEFVEDTKELMSASYLEDVKISEQGQTDIACGNDRYKRVFAATADFKRNDRTADDQLDGAMRSFKGRLVGLGYSTHKGLEGQEDNPVAREYVLHKDNGMPITFTLRIQIAKPGYKVTAETACLPRS